MKIDISKGRYWDRPWSLVSGCTRCSPGCDHCWALAMEQRFKKSPTVPGFGIHLHPDRLGIPLRARKPAVFSVWNDAYHEAVTNNFRVAMYAAIAEATKHIYLILTKRPKLMNQFWNQTHSGAVPFDNVWHGLTVCNQAEADEKIPVFLQVPGKKFLSIEPILGPVNLTCIEWLREKGSDYFDALAKDRTGPDDVGLNGSAINAVILGGETGPGARPMHPDWVRSVRDQCKTAGVPFFFKQWGEWAWYQGGYAGKRKAERVGVPGPPFMAHMVRVGKKDAGRILDGRTHDDLPWCHFEEDGGRRG